MRRCQPLNTPNFSLIHNGKKEIQVVKFRSYERDICRKKRGVTVKVAVTKLPMPKHITLQVKLKDGTVKTAKAYLVSMYGNYAYYFLYASYVEELMPLMNQIQEVKAFEEE